MTKLTARTAPLAAITLVGLALAGCGGDDDDKADGGATPEAAQRVETYLQENTKDLRGSQAEPGKVVSDVQATDGKLKVVTFLNDGVPGDRDVAKKLCDAVKASGVEGADEAAVVDAGDVEIQRC
jgi:hypothetical protein